MKNSILPMAIFMTAATLAGCGDNEVLEPVQEKEVAEEKQVDDATNGEDSEEVNPWEDNQQHDARIDNYRFVVGEDGIVRPESLQPMSSESFRSEIVGSGWRSVGTHSVNSDGTIEENDFYYGMLGVAPEHYFFDEQQLTSFFYASDLPALCYSVLTYQYDEETNIISFEKNHTMTILSYTDDQFAVLDSYNGEYPKLGFYRRMTDEELETTRRTYDKTREEAELETYE